MSKLESASKIYFFFEISVYLDTMLLYVVPDVAKLSISGRISKF